jgi:hypothetical protein
MHHLSMYQPMGSTHCPIAPVLDGVSSDEDMLGEDFSLKFMDHDITDAHKFPELAREKYLHTRSIPGIGEILLEP